MGCSRAIHLHPITDNDFYTIEKPDRGENDYDVCFSKEYYVHKMGKIIKNK